MLVWAADEMEPARRRGDREGVGGGSRMLRLHAQLISASAVVRMNVSKCSINDAATGGTVWLPFDLGALALVSYRTLAIRTRFGRATEQYPGKRGEILVTSPKNEPRTRRQYGNANRSAIMIKNVLMTIFA